MPLLPARLRRRKAVLIFLLLLLIAGAAALLCFRPPPPLVVMLPVADGFGPARPSWFNRGKAALPMWVWRWKQWLLGSSTEILLEAYILDLPGPVNSLLADARLLRAASAATNGMQAWVLADAELTALRVRLQTAPASSLLSGARMQTADGIDGRLSTGNNVTIDGIPTQVGLLIRFSPRIHSDSTDLTTALVLTGTVTNAPPAAAVSLPPTNTVPVRTNLALAARIQLQDGRGIFLLSPDGSPTHNRSIGVFISATPKRRKK